MLSLFLGINRRPVVVIPDGETEPEPLTLAGDELTLAGEELTLG